MNKLFPSKHPDTLYSCSVLCLPPEAMHYKKCAGSPARESEWQNVMRCLSGIPTGGGRRIVAGERIEANLGRDTYWQLADYDSKWMTNPGNRTTRDYSAG